MSAIKAQPTPGERSPLVEMLVLAAPTVAAMSSFTLMQFLDKLMVSRIGPDPIYVGAQGNGGFSSWVPISVGFGLINVINTFVSQNLGNKTPERGAAYCWAGVWISVIYALVVLVPAGFLLPAIYEMLRPENLDPEALSQTIRRDALATSYAQVLLFTGVITLAAKGVAQFFYGMHTPMVVLCAVVGGNITNLLCNSLLIYGPVAPATTDIAIVDGWFRFTASVCDTLSIPQMGVTGAAIATAIGTFVELLIPLAVFVSPKYRRVYHTLAGWKPSAKHIKELVRLGWPAALMFGNEMVCWGIFMVHQVGHFGPKHSTAGWIAHQWMHVSFMPTVGITIAISAMVGKCMGMRRPDLAEQRTWLGVKVAVGYMTLCGVIFVIFRESLIDMFVDPATDAADRALVLALGTKFLIAAAAFQFFDAIAMGLSAALRGAGDTRWPGIVTIILSWTIIAGGGWALVYFLPQLESLGPWIAASTYIIVLAIAMLVRFNGRKWTTIDLLGKSSTTKADMSAGPA